MSPQAMRHRIMFRIRSDVKNKGGGCNGPVTETLSQLGGPFYSSHEAVIIFVGKCQFASASPFELVVLRAVFVELV